MSIDSVKFRGTYTFSIVLGNYKCNEDCIVASPLSKPIVAVFIIRCNAFESTKMLFLCLQKPGSFITRSGILYNNHNYNNCCDLYIIGNIFEICIC